jgi:hypothetical protein
VFDPSNVLHALYDNISVFGYGDATLLGGKAVASVFAYSYATNGNAAVTHQALFVAVPNLFKSSVGIIVAFNIDEWNAEGRAGATDTASMATMLLHEMGHVYNYLTPQGSGGSKIIQNDTGGNLSADNDQLIFRACFP